MHVIRITLAIAILFFAATEAIACSCIPEPTAEASLATYSAVFVGTVEDIERKTPAVVMWGKALLGRVTEWFGGEGYDPTDDDYGLLVTFEVAEGFKSAKTGSEISVSTGFGGGDCGYPFEVGARYLVYAWQSDKSGLSVGICSRTGALNDRAADLRVLRRGT